MTEERKRERYLAAVHLPSIPVNSIIIVYSFDCHEEQKVSVLFCFHSSMPPARRWKRNIRVPTEYLSSTRYLFSVRAKKGFHKFSIGKAKAREDKAKYWFILSAQLWKRIYHFFSFLRLYYSAKIIKHVQKENNSSIWMTPVGGIEFILKDFNGSADLPFSSCLIPSPLEGSFVLGKISQSEIFYFFRAL